jgi:hypothetical protein
MERDPLGAETAPRNYTMDMGMVMEALSRGVRHGEEADLGAEMSGIGSDLEQGRSGGTKKKTVHNPRVLQSQRSQQLRQHEDQVEIRYREEFLGSLGQPLVAGRELAFRAMPVAAGNGEHSITCLMGSSP